MRGDPSERRGESDDRSVHWGVVKLVDVLVRLSSTGEREHPYRDDYRDGNHDHPQPRCLGDGSLRAAGTCGAEPENPGEGAGHEEVRAGATSPVRPTRGR